METPRWESYPLALLLTLTGGFLETYTFFSRDGVFANAQTGNFARMALSFAEGNWGLMFRYAIPILSFILGVTLVIQVRDWLEHSPLLSWRQWLLLLEIVLLFLVSCIPAGPVSNIAANILVSFTCAVQVETFRKFNGNTFASTMCTGNLRLATESLNEFFRSRNPDVQKKSAKYFFIDVTFFTGAVIGAWVTKALGILSVRVCCLTLGLAFCLLFPTKESI